MNTLVSFKSATSPVRPVEMTNDLEKYFKKSMKLYKNKKFLKASTEFLKLSKLFSKTSKQSIASYHAMISNSLVMRARRRSEGSNETKILLEEAIKNLDMSLKHEPYWGEYLKTKSKIERFIHQNFGCVAPFNGKTWSTSCYKVSKALGLPGVSPGWTQRNECSICGKDPVFCDHIIGEEYDGRIALAVAKDIKGDHIAIVEEPRQLETYVLPRPLTEDTLRQILPSSSAKEIIARRRPLTCKDLIKAIHKHNLRGINWK